MKIAVITHTLHSRKANKLLAYAPYVREMDLWFSHFNEIMVVAPLAQNAEKAILQEYDKDKILLKKVPGFSLLSVSEIFKTILKIPLLCYRVFQAMQWANHIHLRCPGNMGLIGCIIQIFFPKKPKTVKYAGNWDPAAKQPWSYKLQKKILSNTLLSRNIKVLVYGNWPIQSVNIVPFFTASFSEFEKLKIEKEFITPFKFLFVGSLVEGKRPFFAIKLIEDLIAKAIPVRLAIYGDGVLRNELEEYVKLKNLDPFIHFYGNKNLEEVKEAYRNSHFVVLASKSEGWPKALAEGMWYGCIPVATPVSCVPWMLKAPSVPKGETNIVTLGERGILIRDSVLGKFQKDRQFECADVSRDISRTGFSEKDLSEIVSLIESPEKLKKMSIAAQEWSQQYTLEKFEKAIQEILGKHNPQPTTHNRETGAENSQPTTGNLELTTDTSELTTDNNNKQQATNPKQLRVLQLIDTLNPGGAERMAVNLVNSLASEIKFSALCVSREEGSLKNELNSDVGYCFLNKKSTLDMAAVFKLKKYIRKNRIQILHAHGTSFFMGSLQKLLSPPLKLVWHDHYGNRIHKNKWDFPILNLCSLLFDGVISVNPDLVNWAKQNLRARQFKYLPNFITLKNGKNEKSNTAEKFIIVSVANLRKPKNHLNLLKAFNLVLHQKPDCQLKLVGKDYRDSYSESINAYIKQHKLEAKVEFTGVQTEVFSILKSSHLGVLSSDSEGFPVSLLEYGLAGLPVVCTKTGKCIEVIEDFGKIVAVNNPEALANAVLDYLSDKETMKLDAANFHKKIIKEYSEQAVLPEFLSFYKHILSE